jgi:hypothetical protein
MIFGSHLDYFRSSHLSADKILQIDHAIDVPNNLFIPNKIKMATIPWPFAIEHFEYGRNGRLFKSPIIH